MMFPKPTPRLLERRKAKAELDRIDREQRALCQQRSGAKCEVRERVGTRTIRCGKFAPENHHLIGGSGRRNKGRSILAAHRLQTCTPCHVFITGNVLVPCVEQGLAELAATVVYERKS